MNNIWDKRLKDAVDFIVSKMNNDKLLLAIVCDDWKGSQTHYNFGHTKVGLLLDSNQKYPNLITLYETLELTDDQLDEYPYYEVIEDGLYQIPLVVGIGDQYIKANAYTSVEIK